MQKKMNYSTQELLDIALSNKDLEDGMRFSASQVRQIVNYKITQLQLTMEERIQELKELIQDTTDDRVNAEVVEVVCEYLDMVEDEAHYQEYALI